MKTRFRETDNPKLTTSYKIQASILSKEMPSLEQVKKISSFFFTRWLSMNRFTAPASNVLNKFYNIPPEVQYIFVNDYAELTDLRNKVKFIGFQKDKKDENLQKLLDNISRLYKVNENTAMEYFDLMNDTERDRIFHIYDVGLVK